MSAYILVSYDIVDQEKYREYVPGVLPLLLKHGAEVLVADSDAQALEGERRGVYVVLRFETEAAALAWYNDPDYAPVRKLRLDASANGNMVLVKPFTPPQG